jgi:hypothetical protein
VQNIPTETESSSTAAQAAEHPPITNEDFVCLLGAFLFFRIPWIFMVPMVEAPDEFAHYWVIKFLREHWRLPGAHEVAAGGASSVYGSLPQLGYIPHVLTTYLANDQYLALTERLGSIIMGQVMLFAAVKIAIILFPKNRLAALAIPIAVAAHPQLAFIHSYANNDSTSSALASLIIWLMLETLRSGISLKRTMAIGALAGWLAMTKYSGLAILPVVAIAVIASVFLHGTAWTFAIGCMAAAALLAIGLCAWWFMHSLQQYPGDMLGTKTMYKSWAEIFHKDQHYYLPASHIIKSLAWWRMTFFSYWGMFGYMTKYLPKPIYFTWLGFVISAAIGALQSLRSFKTWQIDKQFSIKALMWGSLALTLIINIASMIWASVYNYGGPQGRYLITSEIPIQALIIGGMSLFGKKSKWLIIAFLAFNALVCIGSWIYLFRLYGGWHLDPLI